MGRRHITALLTFLLVCTLATPAAAAAPPAATGSFTVQVVGAPALTPIGRTCLLTAPIELTFHGTLAGSAPGEITVLILAPCTAPPGTAPDRFRAEVNFTGAIDGHTGTARITYLGSTDAEGQVTGLMILNGQTGELAHVHGILKVNATAGQGGTYRGRIRGMP